MYAAEGASIVDTEGKTVTIQSPDGTAFVKGTSPVTITVDTYGAKDHTSSVGSISDPTIDRSDLHTYFADGTANTDATVKPAATKITRLKAGKKNVTLSWKKVSGSTGYVLYRSTSKNGTYKKITTTSETSYKDTTVKKNKRYYYKVRTYTKKSGTTVYGKNSDAQSVKTKK